MELTVERGNVVLHDGAIATGALWREHVKVIVAAIRLTVTFMEAIVAERLAALGAEEVLGVPRLFECGHAFLSIKEGEKFQENLQEKILSKFTSKIGPLQ